MDFLVLIYDYFFFNDVIDFYKLEVVVVVCNVVICYYVGGNLGCVCVFY